MAAMFSLNQNLIPKPQVISGSVVLIILTQMYLNPIVISMYGGKNSS